MIEATNAALKAVYGKLHTCMANFDRMKAFPAFTRAKKRASGQKFGSVFESALQYDDPEATGFSFAKAQAAAATAAGSSKKVKFLVPPVTNYQFARVAGVMADRAPGGAQSFVNEMANEWKSAMRRAHLELAVLFFSGQTGARSQIVTVSASPAYVTVTPGTLTRYRVGMNLVASEQDGTGSLRSSTALTVTGVDPDTNKLTLSGSPSSLSWAAGDRLYIDGDFVADTATKPSGLGGWVPAAAPNDTWMGVSRTPGLWQLHGLRYNATGAATIKEALLRAVAKGSEYTQVYTAGFLHPTDWVKLAEQVDGQKHITLKDNAYNLGLSAIELSDSVQGAIPIFADTGVAIGDGWLLNEDQIEYVTSGDELWSLAEMPGQMYHLSDGADAFESRLRFDGNFVVHAPGNVLRISNIG